MTFAINSTPIFQCVLCAKFCDDAGAWLKIESFARLREVIASETQPVTCLLCQSSFAEPMEDREVADRQLPPSDR